MAIALCTRFGLRELLSSFLSSFDDAEPTRVGGELYTLDSRECPCLRAVIVHQHGCGFAANSQVKPQRMICTGRHWRGNGTRRYFRLTIDKPSKGVMRVIYGVIRVVGLDRLS